MRRYLTIAALIFSAAGFAQEATPAPQPAAADPAIKQEDHKDKRDRDADRGDGGVTYSAIGLTRVSSKFDNLKEAINLSAVLGIKVPTIDFVAAEIEFGQTIIPGKNDGRTAANQGGGGGGGTCITPGVPPGCTTGGGGGGSGGNFTKQQDDLGLFSIGAFGVLKTPPEWFYGLYAKGKVGYGYVRSNIDEINKDSSGTAFGAGAGWMYGRRGGVEFLYTKYPGSLDALGLSVSYGFGGENSD